MFFVVRAEAKWNNGHAVLSCAAHTDNELSVPPATFRLLTEAIDTKTTTGRPMWQMVGILAELERSLIQERTKAGHSAAVDRCVRMGRKPLLSVQQATHARQLIERVESLRRVAKAIRVSRRTLYGALAAPC